MSRKKSNKNNEKQASNSEAAKSPGNSKSFHGDPSCQNERFIILEKPMAFGLIDEYDPQNYEILNEILERDVIKIKVDPFLEELLVDRLKTMFVKDLDQDPFNGKHSNEALDVLEQRVSIIQELVEEFPEFPPHSIECGLNESNYDINKTKIALLALRFKMNEISEKAPDLPEKLDIALEINSRKLEPHMVQSSQFGECIKKSRMELIAPREEELSDPSKFYQEAAIHKKWAQEYGEKSRQAFSKKSYALASYYSNLKNEHSLKYLNFQKDGYLKEFKKKYEEFLLTGSFDMHGFTVNQAKDSLATILSPQIMNLIPCKFDYISLITGRGMNSVNSIPKIKNSLISMLKLKKIEYTEINSGSLRIRLNYNYTS